MSRRRGRHEAPRRASSAAVLWARARGVWPEAAAVAAVLGTIAVVVLGLLVEAPDRLGLLLLAAGIGVLAVGQGMRRPLVACVYLLVATFFRLAIPTGTLPVDPFLLAF